MRGLAQLARASALHAEGQRFESVILHTSREGKRIFDMLDIKEETSRASLRYINPYVMYEVRESKQGQTVDALALGGDEGRDKLRKAPGRRK